MTPVVTTAVSACQLIGWPSGFTGTKTRLPGPGLGFDLKIRNLLTVRTEPFAYSTRVRPLSPSRA